MVSGWETSKSVICTTLRNIHSIPKLNGIKVISPTSAQGKKVFTSADAVAAYNPVEKGIFLNKDVLKNTDVLAKYNKQSEEAWDLVMQNIDKLTGSQGMYAETYSEMDCQTAMIRVETSLQNVVEDGRFYNGIVRTRGSR